MKQEFLNLNPYLILKENNLKFFNYSKFKIENNSNEFISNNF